MAHHNLALSENIEMYLVRVAQLQQPDQPVPLSQLAQELCITPVSANEMCRKLTEKGLVTYEPYKGVTLTTDGNTLAQRILRARHLWQAFFVEKLGLDLCAADEMACRFEHVTPDALANRLAAYLELSQAPVADYKHYVYPLADLTAGKRGQVIELTADTVTNNFLKQQGIRPRETVIVSGVAKDGALLLEVSGQTMSLSHHVAQTVQVMPELEAIRGESLMATKQITLDQLPLGEQAVVVRVSGEKSTKRRLLGMGMVPGETVTVNKVAPLGDPLELVVKNYQLSLRKTEASRIIVEVA